MFNLFAGLLKGAGSLFGGGQSGGGPSPISGQAYVANAQGNIPTDNRLGEVAGAKGASFIQPSDKKIGMQYANMGLTAPQLPDVMSLLAGANNVGQQKQQQQMIPITQLINMMKGGR